MTHPIYGLFAKMDEMITSYPRDMVRVPWTDGLIKHTSFFPGGYGFIKATTDDLPAWPEGKVMIVGNDWGNEKLFYQALLAQKKVEGDGPTWSGIRDLLEGLINYEDCFFTNAFMGLREDALPWKGECPGRRDSTFKAQCKAFLREQICKQRPGLILTLGRWIPDMLSNLAPNLAGWRNDKTPHWSEIDSVGLLHDCIAFDSPPKFKFVVCALTHPANARPNYKRRTYGIYENEAGLLAAALEAYAERR